jgi:hypothetical protein
VNASSQVPEDLPIARTAVDDDEEVTDALLRAARRAHVDLDESDPNIDDQIGAGALDTLTAHARADEAAADFVLVADLWGRTFVVRPDAVEVFP